MKNRNTKRIILVLLILLILTGMGYLTLKNQYLSGLSNEDQAKIEVLQQEVEEMEQSVNELDALFESSSQELGRRNELLKEKYAEINLLSEKIDQFKRSGAVKESKIRELEEKLSKARAAILEAFVAETDDLKQENQVLKDSMMALQSRIESGEIIASATPQLPRRVDTVINETTVTTLREATPEEMKLKATNFIFSNVDPKRAGKGEIGTSFKVKDIKELQICFDIRANNVAEKNIRHIYLVYTNPSGTVQYAGNFSGSFAYNGSMIKFSAKTSLDYKGELSSGICMPYSPDKIPLEPGVQTITVFNDGNIIGKQQFTLK